MTSFGELDLPLPLGEGSPLDIGLDLLEGGCDIGTTDLDGDCSEGESINMGSFSRTLWLLFSSCEAKSSILPN